MKKSNEIIKVGWYIPKDIKEDFVNFCADNSTLVQEACAGALLLFTQMPVQIRSAAQRQAKGIQTYPKSFWDNFRAGIEAGIKVRLEAQDDKPPHRPKK